MLQHVLQQALHGSISLVPFNFSTVRRTSTGLFGFFKIWVGYIVNVTIGRQISAKCFVKLYGNIFTFVLSVRYL